MRNKYDLLFNATEAYSKNTTRNGKLELHQAILNKFPASLGFLVTTTYLSGMFFSEVRVISII